MYEKKLDTVMKAPGVIGLIGNKKKRVRVPAFVAVLAKYTAYILGVVLFLLLVALILKSVLLSPAGDYQVTAKSASVLSASLEAPMSSTSAIFPKTAVYYHGVRLGEYDGEDITVAEVMEKFNITLGPNDVTNYAPEESLFYGMTLNIDEVYYDEQVINAGIPFDVIEIESQTVPKGQRIVQQDGVMGSRQQVVKYKYVNGEAVEEIASFERVIPPVNEEILVGVGGVFTAPDGKEYNYSYYIDVTATAYTHTGDPTYMGTVAEVGVIAVDPRNIALGSQVYVIGNYGDYGLCRAEDIGGGIKGKRIDVFLDTEEECVRFGRRKMRAYVME